jgi:UDP-N-acetylmuramate--alanine ligase
VLGRIRRIHFVGIGGIGMSGIAELLVNRGFEVSGSDAKRSDVTARLERLGVRVHEGHAAAHVADADVVVVSSAIRPGNPEVEEATRRGIPVVPRAEMLAELMRLRRGIAVAGAHGKTSTTSMIALVLERAGLDPTAVIGGRLSAFGSNARLGRGEYIVVEADESDGSFLRLSPEIAVITNVDYEHLEHYGTFAGLLDAFVEFANRVPLDGAVVLCADDEHLAAVRGRILRRVVTYGFGPDADVSGSRVELAPFAGSCQVTARARGGAAAADGPLRLRVPGRHNLSNALAAVAVGRELGLPFEAITDALAGFQGAERRFERKGESAGVTVVDDYGHHPTEIAAVIAAARASTRGRVIVAFQPHRFSRTARLAAEFAAVLATADAVVLTDIYGAGEDPIPGVTSDALAARMRGLGMTAVDVHALEHVPRAAARLARPGDMVITLGAGSIGGIGPRILDEIGRARAGGASES